MFEEVIRPLDHIGGADISQRTFSNPDFGAPTIDAEMSESVTSLPDDGSRLVALGPAGITSKQCLSSTISECISNERKFFCI